MAQAAAALEPPPHLDFFNRMEREYFERLLKARAPDDWLPHDFDRLKTATENWWFVQVGREAMADEDDIVIDDNGKSAVNPRLRAIDIYQKTHDATLRALGISRSGIKPETLAKRRDDIGSARREIPGDRLLTQARGSLTVIDGGRPQPKGAR